MSQLSAPSASLDTLHSGDGPLGPPPAAAQLPHAVNPGQALFQLNIRRSLQLHRRLAWAVALMGIALSILYFFRLWPQYLAKSLIYVQPSSPEVLQGGAPVLPYDGSNYESYLQQQMATVTRADVIESALHKLPPGTWQKGGESDQAAAISLGHAIQAEQTSAYQFTIGGRSSNPQLAAELANAVTSSYIEIASRRNQVRAYLADVRVNHVRGRGARRRHP